MQNQQKDGHATEKRPKMTNILKRNTKTQDIVNFKTNRQFKEIMQIQPIMRYLLLYKVAKIKTNPQ